MLEARSVDIVMIDVVRAGGITQWMKIAGMAEAFNRAGRESPVPGDFACIWLRRFRTG